MLNEDMETNANTKISLLILHIKLKYTPRNDNFAHIFNINCSRKEINGHFASVIQSRAEPFGTIHIKKQTDESCYNNYRR